MRLLFFTSLCLLCGNIFLSAQTGCPGCTISLPPMPEDTLYLSMLPEGNEGEYYDHSLSFRLPKTTTPVNAIDPTTPAGLTISNITVLSVSNLPPGISWQASQTVFNPATQTDGCVRFCGTPIGNDTFHIVVTLAVQISIITQNSTFTLPLYIAPSVGGEGFSMVDFFSCGPTTTTFVNNVPSNGQNGFTYAWDFGNGNTSTLENPEPQTYTTPNEYPVQFTATIDTTGYILTTVQLLTATCNDFNLPPANNPDLFINIIDAQSQLVFTSSQITNSSIPALFSLNVLLPEGNYTLEVWDDDSGLAGDDDLCGSFAFSNSTNNSTLTTTDATASVTIIHPISTIIDTDTVTVLEVPATPVVTADQSVLCQGDVALLTSSESVGNQWIQDSVVVIGGTTNTLTVNESGFYSVFYTAPNGCSASSDPLEIVVNPIPTQIQFVNQSNVLTVFNPTDLPADYQLVWVINSVASPDTGSLTYCITENCNAALIVTDVSSGCTNTFALDVIFNPLTPCYVNTSDAQHTEWRISPNPGNYFTLSTDNQWEEDIRLDIISATGAKITELTGSLLMLNTQLPSISAQLPTGTYFVRVAQKGNSATMRFIKL